MSAFMSGMGLVGGAYVGGRGVRRLNKKGEISRKYMAAFPGCPPQYDCRMPRVRRERTARQKANPWIKFLKENKGAYYPSQAARVEAYNLSKFR